MKRILLSLLLLWLPLTVLADGMVVPTIAYPTKVTIPDQRALICFANGIERLVIETRFTGTGTNFAWVIPLPSQPVIKQATTGLFPTLQYLFRPTIIHQVKRDYQWILIGLGLILTFWFLIKHTSTGFTIFIGFLFVLAAGLLLPALSAAKGKAMSTESSETSVAILDRKIVGLFETTIVASHDAKALQAWLVKNGFTVPEHAKPAIASYVQDGWVFVCAKVRRDKPDGATSTAHPLSFIFKTSRPVYPMRLTGVENGNNAHLEVALYVFGPARATAPHFQVERCTRPNYPEPPPNDSWSWNWARWSPETPNIVHPLLRKWVNGLPVATKLTARLSPDQMRQDVWLDWVPFRETKNHLFSREGALTIGLNWGSWLLLAGLATVWLLKFANAADQPTRPKLILIVVVTSLGVAGLVYAWLPKTGVRLVKVSYVSAENNLYALYAFFLDTAPVTRKEISHQMQNLLTNPTNNPDWNNSQGGYSRFNNLDNYLLGGRIREEDSPGNFTLREDAGQLEFIAYDAQGAEHIFQEKWNLQPPH